jgi:ribonuclease P protein component
MAIRYRSITKSVDFAITRQRGFVFKDQFIVIFVNANGAPFTQIGLSVSRRVGNAVIRNKVKRRLRTILSLISVAGGVDVLIVARVKVSLAGYKELNRSLFNLTKKAGIVEDI